MHISEGILSGSVLAAGWAGTCAFTAIGLKRTDTSRIVRTALVSSAFFLASLVNVRVGPSSTHLSLIAPMGLALGWGVFPAVLTALLLQAVLFGFGGLLVLGVNTFVIGSAALSVYLLFGRVIREGKNRAVVLSVSFIAGALGVILGAVLVGVSLGLTDRNFMAAAKVLVTAHVPVAVIEGAVSAFLVMRLKKSAPEFLA
ncbi:MAG: cobalt transporter CbiM [Synergistaceae bacterium]|nr:cobalt transporter CbiM [Synergistaceae bacterium]